VTQMSGESKYTVSKKVIEQRRNAKLQHGARSGAVVVPLSRNVKQSLLKRMGMRQAELTWAGRETLDLYSRNKAKLIALDRYFEAEPFIQADGSPHGATKVYWTCFNAAVRTLAELRAVIEAMAREDARYDKALHSLAAEGKRVREGRNGDE
jgi:hypothetical protein